MNRIKKTFRSLAKEGRCGLIAFVTCGDPDPESTVEVVLELERAGADCIELGVPFSDPIADGPVIQSSSHRALKNGMTVSGCLQIAAKIRERSQIPLVAFSYVNPLLRFGIDRFAEQSSRSGIDGLLTTDLPPEASDDVRGSLRRRGLSMMFLVSPTSTDARIRLADKASDGFVYYVSTTGVTGVRRELDSTLVERLREVRGRLKNPMVVGFGVSGRAHYEALSGVCDAVVVGSAIVRAVHDGDAAGAPGRAGDVVRSILGSE